MVRGYLWGWLFGSLSTGEAMASVNIAQSGQ
jgi:hypothetical protein